MIFKRTACSTGLGGHGSKAEMEEGTYIKGGTGREGIRIVKDRITPWQAVKWAFVTEQ